MANFILRIEERTHMAINRYMIRCCYCKQTFAIEGTAPYQMAPVEALELVRAHGESCPTTGKRMTFRAYGSTDSARLARAAYDILTADWKVSQVRGTYSADVRCNGRCTNAKGGDCQCECGGKNHGTGLVLQTLAVA
jgi:hypothetical protein